MGLSIIHRSVGSAVLMNTIRRKNTHPATSAGQTRATHTLGVVSYLNARPLYDTLRNDSATSLLPEVPARLHSLLMEGRCDAALLPVVDYFRSRAQLQRVSDGCIASDGETMTVRVFANRPAEQIHRLHVDGESHTSIILAQVIWHELYGQRPELLPWNPRSPGSFDDVEALLLIGDKVVRNAPLGFGFEVDLGAAWRYLTGLPFVFAAWYGRAGRDFSDLARVLEAARDEGVKHAERIARASAAEHGWPEETAVHYLCHTLRFKLTTDMLAGMNRFFELAVRHGLLPAETPGRQHAKTPNRHRAGSNRRTVESAGGGAQPNSHQIATSPNQQITPPQRVTTGELRSMYFNLSIHELGRLALGESERLHPEDYRTYVVDRNINYANWCTAKCIFCNFKADPPEMKSGRTDLPAGYTLSFDEIGRKIDELVAIGGTQILMQGGLVPKDGAAGLPFEWYLDLMRFIKTNYPRIHIHAFSPPEIFAFHQVFGMAIHDVLARLMEAGLDTVPGGGGEILSDRVRRKIGVGKTMTGEWLEVMRQCHMLGMRTSCTMMFGHIETIDERFEHLRLLRELQDESLARGNGGGFGAFICWTFQPDNTPLGRMRPLPAETSKRRNVETSKGNAKTAKRQNAKTPNRQIVDGGAAELEPTNRQITNSPNHQINDGKHLLLADAHEYLTMLALSRLYLDNIPNIQSSWVTMGPKIGQLSLFYGANDMGSVMMEENVVSAAGTTYRLNEPEIRRLISDAGWRPQKRDYYHRPLD